MSRTRRRRIDWTLAAIFFLLTFAWLRSMHWWLGFGLNSNECVTLANGAVQYSSGSPLVPTIFQTHPVQRSPSPWDPVWWFEHRVSRATPPLVV